MVALSEQLEPTWRCTPQQLAFVQLPTQRGSKPLKVAVQELVALVPVTLTVMGPVTVREPE